MTATELIERLEQAAHAYADVNRRVSDAIYAKEQAVRAISKRRDVILMETNFACNVSREQREAMVAEQMQPEIEALEQAKDALHHLQAEQHDAKVEWMLVREVARVWSYSAEANHG